MQNAGFLFAAFTIIWALVFVYVIILVSRQRKLRHDIELLREALKEKGGQ